MVETPNEPKTAQVITAITELDNEALARVWVDFNRWQWPRDFPQDAKPRWWDGLPLIAHNLISERKSGFMTPFMAFVETKIDDGMIDAEWKRATGIS